MEMYSQCFGIKHAAFVNAGVFDGFIGEDAAFHVNPLMLQNCKEPEFENAYHEFLAHFTKVILLAKKVVDMSLRDKYFRQIVKLFTFKETPNTGLGYSKRGTRGNGISGSLSAQLAKNAVELVRDGIEDPIYFTLLPLFEEKVAADRFSDMTIAILIKNFYAYSLRKAKELGIHTGTFFVENGTERKELPYYNNKYIILIPDCILSNLPMASDPSDIGDVSGYNSSLRKVISEAIGITMADFEKWSKQAKKESLLANKDNLVQVLATISTARFLPYDFSIDKDWVYLKMYVEEHYSSLSPLAMPQLSEENFLDIVLMLCNKFKQLIEVNRMSTLLFNEETPQNESFVQRLFFCVVKLYCDDKDIDVNRESNPGCGALDFKFSQGSTKKVIIEIKLSSHRKVKKGLTTQLPIYLEADNTQNGVFMLLRMDPKDDTRIQDVVNEHESLMIEHKPKLILIDAVPRESASKL